MIKPSIRPLLSLPAASPALGRIVDLFAVMLSQLRRTALDRKSDGGVPSPAGRPAEAEIPPQSQTCHMWNQAKMPERRAGSKHNTQIVA